MLHRPGESTSPGSPGSRLALPAETDALETFPKRIGSVLFRFSPAPGRMVGYDSELPISESRLVGRYQPNLLKTPSYSLKGSKPYRKSR